jgi:hypothetical protein
MRIRLLTAVGLSCVGIALAWSIAHAQPKPGELKPTQSPPGEQVRQERPLDTLDWLVGDWVNEDEARSIEFNCHFTKNGAFLVRSFRIVTAKDVSMSGMQLIAWDPAKKGIRSWTFDSDGGFGEDIWSQSGNRYTIRAKYTLPDGGTASAVNVFTFVNDSKCTWKSVSREIDGELQPDTDEIVLVRKTVEPESKGEK